MRILKVKEAKFLEIRRLKKTRKLEFYECLKGRREFSEEEKYDFGLIGKGFYNGEAVFNQMVREYLNPAILVISDLVVNDGQWYQIDNLILTGKKLYVNEIKYLKGPLTYNHGDLYINRKKMKDDYFRKFNRIKELLEYSLRQQGLEVEVIPHLVFMNPSMMFYGNSPELPVLLHNQVVPFLKNILPQGNHYSQRVADFLLSMHTEENPFEKKNLSLDRSNLRHGIRCLKCSSLDLRFDQWKSHCLKCGNVEFKAAGVRRNIKEFQILYPEEKPSPIDIYRWCNGKVSRRTIYQVLKSSKYLS